MVLSVLVCLLLILLKIADFNHCLARCRLDDIRGTGNTFTWTNNLDGEARIWSKLDRALANTEWLVFNPTTYATFMHSDILDHSPVLITVLPDIKHSSRFSFLTCWTDGPSYA